MLRFIEKVHCSMLRYIEKVHCSVLRSNEKVHCSMLRYTENMHCSTLQYTYCSIVQYVYHSILPYIHCSTLRYIYLQYIALYVLQYIRFRAYIAWSYIAWSYGACNILHRRGFEWAQRLQPRCCSLAVAARLQVHYRPVKWRKFGRRGGRGGHKPKQRKSRRGAAPGPEQEAQQGRVSHTDRGRAEGGAEGVRGSLAWAGIRVKGRRWPSAALGVTS